MEIDPPTTNLAAPKPRKVPEFDADDDRPKMNAQQRAFYLDDFLPGLLAGSPVDAQGNSGYAGELLFELMEQRHTEPVAARERLVALKEAHRWQDLPYFFDGVLADFHFLEADFAAGLEVIGKIIDYPAIYLTLAENLGHPYLTARQVFTWADSGAITQKGLAMLDEIFGQLQANLDDFHDAHGVSAVEEFWRRLSAEGTIEDVARSVEDDVLQRYSGGDVRHLLELGRSAESVAAPYRAFRGFAAFEEPINWPGPWVESQRYYGLIWERCRALVRSAENMARKAAEVPGVGEGWISEMTLLREIEAAFPGERVVHQAQPAWLKPQSLDIYLSDHNIGIEYQGAQHSRPVEFFGGQEAFERQRQRDADKAGACEDNGCILIAVHPGYRLEDVVAAVRVAFEGARVA